MFAKTGSDGFTIEVPANTGAGVVDDILVSAASQGTTRLGSVTGKLRFRNPCGSFVPSTDVAMADGSWKPISTLSIGDRVQSSDPFGDASTSAVTQTMQYPAHDRVDLVTASGTISTTANHRFKLFRQAGWLEAKQLVVGDQLEGRGNTAVLVKNIQTVGVPVGSVHDLSVAPDHTYLVRAGTAAVVVHNAGCPIASAAEADALRASRGRFTFGVRNHRNGAIAEELGWRHAIGLGTTKLKDAGNLAQLGHTPILSPGQVTAPGVDYITFDRLRNTIVVWDAKASGGLKQRFRTNQAILDAKVVCPTGGWCQELTDAVNALPANYPDRAAIVAALTDPTGQRVRGEFFRWRMGAGHVR